MKQYRSSSLMSTGSGCSPPTAPAPKDNALSGPIRMKLVGGSGGRGSSYVSYAAPIAMVRGMAIPHWVSHPASAQTCASLPNSIRVAVASVGSGARKITGLSGGIGKHLSGSGSKAPVVPGHANKTQTATAPRMLQTRLEPCRVQIPASIPKYPGVLPHGVGGSASAPKLMEVNGGL